MTVKANRAELFDKIRFEFGAIRTVTRPQILEVCSKYGLDKPNWLLNDVSLRVGRGVYAIPEHGAKVASAPAPAAKKVAAAKPAPAPAPKAPEVVAMVAPSVVSTNAELSLVPEKAVGYVPFGHFPDVRSIIKSKKFYPTYITGLSGNGKTMMVEQICAAEKREMVRVNITIETDEDDLIGGFRLINGETV